MKFFCAIVLVCLTQGALSQVVSDGQCPFVIPKPDFNMAIVDGFWFIQKDYPWAGTAGLDCVYTSYKDIFTNFSAALGGVQTSDQQEVLIPYNAKPVANGDILFTIEDRQINVLAIASDNLNYVTFYGCRNSGEQKVEFVWILTRERNPSQSIVDAAVQGLEDNGIDSSPLVDINQQNCPAPVAQS